MPRWLMRALWRGLEREPGKRPDSMAALLSALGPRRHRRRRVRVISGAVAATALLAASFGLAVRRDPCVGTDTSIEQDWNAETLRSLDSALANNEIAAVLRPSIVVQKIERFTGEWRSSARQACSAWAKREQSDTLYDTRRFCLFRKREELKAWLTLLLRDGTLAPRFLADNALVGVESCADVSTLTTVTPPPREGAARNAVETLQRDSR